MNIPTQTKKLSGEDRIRTCGRGFMPRQPLSRRPQSTTLAPPQGGVRGIRTPGGREPTTDFKSVAFVRSAITPFWSITFSGRKKFYHIVGVGERVVRRKALLDSFVCKWFDRTGYLCYKIGTFPLFLRGQGARRFIPPLLH
jgi:hypothetical protein